MITKTGKVADKTDSTIGNFSGVDLRKIVLNVSSFGECNYLEGMLLTSLVDPWTFLVPDHFLMLHFYDLANTFFFFYFFGIRQRSLSYGTVGSRMNGMPLFETSFCPFTIAYHSSIILSGVAKTLFGKKTKEKK